MGASQSQPPASPTPSPKPETPSTQTPASGSHMGSRMGYAAVGKMKKRQCAVDPKLAADSKRKAPPIKPGSCKKGSLAMGKDGKVYKNTGSSWRVVTGKKVCSVARSRLLKVKVPCSPKRGRASPKKTRKTPMRKRKSVKKSPKTPKRRTVSRK